VISYPWYEDLKPDDPLSQGDLIRACPTLSYTDVDFREGQSATQALEAAVVAQETDCIVMTQACDLEHDHVREVILCPVYDVESFRALYEEEQRKKGQNLTPKNWNRQLNNIREGKIWNLNLLNERVENQEKAESAVSFQIVDFHEIFSLPKAFLIQWMKQNPQPRVRLLPPYREHLSQAFARYFMRVGLPDDIPSFPV
jgi:hypothetical protein